MGKVKGKHRLDKYYHLAKEHGYRSRASWKLLQLDSKFNFLRSSRSVLDLCAAPGGWMQVSVDRVPVGSLVIGVDLVPIKPIRGAIAVQEDITNVSKCRATIKSIMVEKGCSAFDLVLHDGSPNVGGAWAKEAADQNALVIDSVRLAAELLAPNGTFVTKVFRSQDYSAVLYCLRQLFEKVEVDKPLASRSASSEIYILGLKYKAPSKIDPRLLDVKHLFQGAKEPPKVVNVLRGTKQKRHRDGYEDGDTTLRKVCSAADFVWSNSYLDILGSVTSITFDDPASLPMRDQPLTTEEVKTLCDDLRVLGKLDFRHLLKWRMHMRKALAPSEKISTPKAIVDCESKEDERLAKEELDATLRKKNREKKLLAKKQTMDKARKALGTQIDATEDSYADLELFSLTSIKGKKDLVTVGNYEYDDESAEVNSEDDGDDLVEPQDYISSDVDSDEERRRRDEEVEKFLEELNEEGTIKQRKRAKISYLDNGKLLQGGDEDGTTHSSQVSDSDKEVEDAVNPLVVSLESAPSQQEVVSNWFTQDIFVETEEQDMLDKYDSEDEMLVDGAAGENAPLPKRKTTDKSQGEDLLHVPTSEAAEDFEIVPAPAMDSSDSSSDESDEDIGIKPDILATTKSRLGKKQREETRDDGYNKNMYHDEGLPKWFVDEEKRHRQPMKPVTKEEVAAMRAQFKAIDARPAKKVAEAKARKKQVAHRKLEKIRKKANSISDQAEISDISKRRMIEQLYKKATTPKRAEKEYVVAKKGVQVKVGKGKVLVDRRMKKDARRRVVNNAKGRRENKNGNAWVRHQQSAGSRGEHGAVFTNKNTKPPYSVF